MTSLALNNWAQVIDDWWSKGNTGTKKPADKYADPDQFVSKHILVKALLFEVLFSRKEK